MQGFRNVLVGVDLSHADRLAASELNAPTLEAVKRAIWLGEQISAELTFFSAIDLSAHALEILHEGIESSTHTVEQDAHEVLAELVAQAREQGVRAQSKLVFGRSWVELISQVLREKHDLLLVGTRDRSGPSRLLFGSTGMKLLRYCPCPVWVTKPDPDWSTLNVLVASDLSDVSQQALEIAVSGGQLQDSKIHLVHSLQHHLDIRLWHTKVSDEQSREYRNKVREEAETRLHQQLANTDYRTLTYGVQMHVLEGPADEVIMKVIEENEIDLLVMGTVARGGLSGMLIGNIAERLLPQVPCSVLAVKPEDFHCPIDIEE